MVEETWVVKPQLPTEGGAHGRGLALKTESEFVLTMMPFYKQNHAYGENLSHIHVNGRPSE